MMRRSFWMFVVFDMVVRIVVGFMIRVMVRLVVRIMVPMICCSAFAMMNGSVMFVKVGLIFVTKVQVVFVKFGMFWNVFRVQIEWMVGWALGVVGALGAHWGPLALGVH